jgi:hypothetical protein
MSTALDRLIEETERGRDNAGKVAALIKDIL